MLGGLCETVWRQLGGRRERLVYHGDCRGMAITLPRWGASRGCAEASRLAGHSRVLNQWACKASPHRMYLRPAG